MQVMMLRAITTALASASTRDWRMAWAIGYRE